MQRYCIEEKRFMGGMQLVSSACPSAIYDSTFSLKKQAFSYCFNWISIVSSIVYFARKNPSFFIRA